ncbi:pentapeptide repeat-containing protein [Lusitaniella coriacea]|uniref:pentapeptide repeat-containing protein n=1 Tax=Lusitaniella coriacea TaxID=1983105 RepID=UPI003CF36AD4
MALGVNSGKFITTESLGKAGEAGERIVWEAVQAAFATRDCLGYWRYPIFSQQGEYRKEPDILIADRALGLFIIEVKSIAIAQIITISGHQWQYQDFYATTGNPYQQAEHQLFSLLGYCNQEPELKDRVGGRAMVALPQITEAEWQERGFDRLPASPPILFKDCLSPESIRARAEQTPSLTPGNPLTEEEWQLLLSVLAGTPLYRQPTQRVLAPSQSRGKILQQMRDRATQLDLQQERIAKQIPPGPQRIRGIAGSGKTVLLCQKAAHIHLKHPNWTIALVFFSRSLYPPILEQLDRWLRYFSNNEIGYDPKNRNLRVLHAWGAKQQPGLYSTLCWEACVQRLAAKDTQSKQPQEALAEACTHLLKTAAIPQCFDAILIDEGQDLVVDRGKFEDKQPFYWLAYQSLRPIDPAYPEQRRLIWAYDEAQSLESTCIPTASELFGESLGHLVTGTYPDGIFKTETLYRSYRTPHRILTAARAIGMGLLRPGGMLAGMTREEDWNAIGYEVKGRFHHGCTVTLHCSRDRSPHPIDELWRGSYIQFKTFQNRQEELTYLAQSLLSNLRNDGLRPSRDILVLILGTFYEAQQLETQVAQFLMQQGLDIFIPSTADCNILKPDKRNYHPNQFWCEGAITVSRIHRAKGHEAPLVYILGLDRVAEDESNLSLRNQLFVALTRSRAWVNLSGIGNFPFYNELRHVLHAKDTFTFSYHRPTQRETIVTEIGEILQLYAAGRRNFQGADLSGAHLAGIHLQNANFIGANLSGANLSHANLDGVKFVAADLTEVDLRGASLRKVKFLGASLKNAQLNHADLSFAQLHDADLTGACLQNATLKNTDLE